MPGSQGITERITRADQGRAHQGTDNLPVTAAAPAICEFKIYPDAPHGFLADYRPSYRADDAKDASARMLAWFKEHGVA